MWSTKVLVVGLVTVAMLWVMVIYLQLITEKPTTRSQLEDMISLQRARAAQAGISENLREKHEEEKSHDHDPEQQHHHHGNDPDDHSNCPSNDGENVSVLRSTIQDLGEKLDHALRDKVKADLVNRDLTAEMEKIKSELEKARQKKSVEVAIPNNDQDNKNNNGPPSGDSVTLRRFNQAKFAYNWLKSLVEEERDHAVRAILKHSRDLPSIFDSVTGEGTSFRCYQFSREDIVKVFGGVSSGSVCIFENVCVTGNSFMAIGNQKTHGKYGFTNGQRFDWPQTLNGAGPRLVFVEKEDPAGFLNHPNRKWEESFSWLITNSYARHTAHWFETISQIFVARKYLGEELLPEAKKVFFTTHGSDLFDWQKGTLSSSLNQKDEPELFFQQFGGYNNDNPLCFKRGYNNDNPLCFKRAAIPGYLFYMFAHRDVGVAFKHTTYERFGMGIPSSLPKVVTLASRSGKRAIANENEVIAFIKMEYPDVEVKTVKFGQLSYKEQVQSMHDSAIMIGMHGADITNAMFLPEGGAVIEINPYRFYDNRFFGITPLAGVNYFSYNCGKGSCARSGGGGGNVKEWPISGYPPATDNDCRRDLDMAGQRDTDVIVDFNDFGYVLKEVFGHLGWGPKLPDSVWNIVG